LDGRLGLAAVANSQFPFWESRPLPCLDSNLAFYLQRLMATPRPRVFMDIALGENPIGRSVFPRVSSCLKKTNPRPLRIVFQLYSDLVPKTAEKWVYQCHDKESYSSCHSNSFRVLCTGELGHSPVSGHALYYKNSIFHRVIPEFMIQGGGPSFPPFAALQAFY
jgi:Cyclophilin type peptidyl-prolyl cis-trans isomerase/CLD